MLDYAKLSDDNRRKIRHEITNRLFKELNIKKTEKRIDDILFILESVLEDR